MVGPELVYMLACCAYGFKTVASFDQVRVHVVNREIAVNVVAGAFVTAHGDRCSAEICATAHAYEALVGFCGNPVFPLLQVFAFLHNLHSCFGEVAATVRFECNAVEGIGLAGDAVLFGTGRFAPSAVFAFGFGNGVAELPKVVSAFGHENRDCIVAL